MGVIGFVLRLGRNISSGDFKHNIVGSAAVEMAALAPLLVVLVLGVSDAGRAVAQKMRLNDAAQQGAQYGLVRNPIQGDVSGITDVMGAGAPGTDRVNNVRLFCECVAGTEVACTTTCAGGLQRHRYLDVTARENYYTLFSNSVFDATIPLRANVVVRLQ